MTSNSTVQEGLFVDLLKGRVVQDEDKPRFPKSGIAKPQTLEICGRLEDEPLNPEQQTAVGHFYGPILVDSGAGTGKTRVVTMRIALLVAAGVQARRILATTFTNRAAEEMEHRIDPLLGTSVRRRPLITTLHGLGVDILREHAHLLKYARNFEIIDDLDQTDHLEAGLRKLRHEDLAMLGGKPTEALGDMISVWKNDLVHPAKATGPYAAAYREYQKSVRESGGIDVDDLIRLPCQLFTAVSESPEVLLRWQKKWDFILCDEFQDTNHAQHEMLKLLAKLHGNFCAVGDGDQSIYGWRGARVEYIRNFESHWPGARVVRLQQNYRSVQNILDRPNDLMKHEPERSPKNLVAHRGEGDEPVVVVHGDEKAEAKWIAETIRASKRRLSDISVIVRSRRVANPIMEALQVAGIKYEDRLKDPIRFGEQKRNIYALLKCIDNPSKSDMSLIRLIFMEEFSILPKEFEEMSKRREEVGTPLWEQLPDVIKGLSGDSKKKVRKLKRLVTRLHKRHEAHKTSKASSDSLASIASDGVLSIYPNLRVPATKSSEECLDPWLDLKLGYIASYEDSARRPSLRGYIGHEFRIARNRKAPEVDELVVVQSIHSSKGEEYDCVFLPGCEQGIVPSRQAMEAGDEAISEERRVMFVGMTRPKTTLYVSFANNRKGPGGHKVRQMPSQFLEESGLDGYCMESSSQKQLFI